MYTRSYFAEDKSVAVPENYDGTTFNGASEVFGDEAVGSESKAKDEESESEKSVPVGNRIGVSQFFERLPLKSLFSIKELGSYLTGHRLIPEKIGMDEALILAISLYLFFSKDGDKECAVMLLILLFIN